MIKGSKHSQETIEKIRQSCIGITRVHDNHVDTKVKLVCEHCHQSFTHSIYERNRKFCSIVCSAEKQWKDYNKQPRVIGEDWKDYHKLPTKQQEYMLEDFKKYMCEEIVNNKK